MKIGIFGRIFQSEYNLTIQRFIQKLQEKNIEVFIYKSFDQYLRDSIDLDDSVEVFKSYKEARNFDFIISVGGDGTMLGSLNIVRDSGVPVLGLNTGRLGFLSIVGLDEIDLAIEALITGDYSIDERSLIEVSCSDDTHLGFNYALNEVTVYKKDTSSMIIVEAFMNDDFISSYWADGLIISTPTGSTAYSLSAGGPIVMPNSENLVLTPISPHNMNVRPLVVSNDNKITLKASGRGQEYLLTLDAKSHTIDPSVEVYLKKADFKVRFVQLKGKDFFNTIRAKLNWGLDIRNRS